MPIYTGDSLLAAHDAGMNVIVKEAMANGRLTDRNKDPEFAPKLKKLQETASQVRNLFTAAQPNHLYDCHSLR